MAEVYNPLDKSNLGRSVANALLAQPVHPLGEIPPFEGATQATLERIVVSPEDAAEMSAGQSLFMEMQVVPHKSLDGDPVGMRLSGIRLDSLGARIGLRNGDEARAFRAGRDVWTSASTLESFVGFYGAFRLPLAGREVELLVTRRGALTVLRFEGQ